MAANQRRILFLSKSLSAASARHRAVVYFDHLRQAGWEPAILPAGGASRISREARRAARGADVVVLMRRTPAWPWLALLRRAAGVLVFDLDDAIFLASTGEPSRTRRERFERVARAADAVWAGNSYLAEYAGQFSDQVAVLPTSLDPQPYHVAVNKPNDSTDVVWIGSSATRPYLEASLPALALAARRIVELGLPPLRLKIVADFDLPNAGVPTLAVPWSPSAETTELASSHVGIAPLTDDPWTRGKCGFKILQYMAAGLPVVASPVGVHTDIILDGETGLLARDEAAWADAIARLAADAELRSRMGAAGRVRVCDRYSLDATFKLMHEQLDRLI